jgi:hypothetical protein
MESTPHLYPPSRLAIVPALPRFGLVVGKGGKTSPRAPSAAALFLARTRVLFSKLWPLTAKSLYGGNPNDRSRFLAPGVTLLVTMATTKALSRVNRRRVNHLALTACRSVTALCVRTSLRTESLRTCYLSVRK